MTVLRWLQHNPTSNSGLVRSERPHNHALAADRKKPRPLKSDVRHLMLITKLSKTTTCIRKEVNYGAKAVCD
jgi:hypothetical protein